MPEQVSPPENAQSLPQPAETAGGSGMVLLKGEIEISSGERMPHLDQGPVKAYAAKTRNQDKAFALICERNILPNTLLVSKYHSLASSGLPRLVASGVVDWSPLQQQRYVFVYEDKLGMPIATPQNINAMNLKNDLVLSTVVANLVPTIKTLRDADFVHGGIRVGNLYNSGGQGLDKVVLGECLCAPHGYLQPVIYETIERGSADPLGRGEASPEDDMYAFGVTLAVLLRGIDPLVGKSTHEILREKIEHGSYAAITGKERFTGSLLECLRGLLNDDRHQRWTIDDVLTWMDGRRVHTQSGGSVKLRASRPLDFVHEKYLKPQSLAFEMPLHAIETQRLVEGNELHQWLNRSVQDKVLEDRTEDAINAAQKPGTSGTYPDRLACYLSLALSPNMPMVFRGTRMMPHAFGSMLFEAAATKKDMNPYVEIIQNSMAMFWVNTQENWPGDINTLISKFESCRAFLRQSVIGYGLERCIYYLAEDSYCLSDKLKNFYVRTSEDYLNALERLSTSGGRPEGFFDRHIIAFLSVRERQVIDPYIPDLNASEKHRHYLATLRILAAIQERSKMPPMPGVTSWLADVIDPLINRLHDRDARASVKSQVQKLKEKGDIIKMSALFANPQLFQDDFKNFRQGLKDYTTLRQEHAVLTDKLDNDKTYGHGTGRQIAAAVSGLASAIIILIFMAYKLSG